MKVIICTISRADLKANNYNKAVVKQSSGTAPQKRSIALVAAILKKVATE